MPNAKPTSDDRPKSQGGLYDVEGLSPISYSSVCGDNSSIFFLIVIRSIEFWRIVPSILSFGFAIIESRYFKIIAQQFNLRHWKIWDKDHFHFCEKKPNFDKVRFKFPSFRHCHSRGRKERIFTDLFKTSFAQSFLTISQLVLFIFNCALV